MGRASRLVPAAFVLAMTILVGAGRPGAAAASPPPSSAAVGTVTILEQGIDNPRAIAWGTGGFGWFTMLDAIGRVAPDGTVTIFPDRRIQRATDIVEGADGAMWFANQEARSLGRIASDGTITMVDDAAVGRPARVALGPDGRVWFTNDTEIGAVATDGTVTVYASADVHEPTAITAGPDGAMWFTDAAGDPGGSVGRMTVTGAVTIFDDPAVVEPTAITTGPDGNLWFTDAGSGADPGNVGRITPAGAITTYTGAPIDRPVDIVAGPDGKLWFTVGGAAVHRAAGAGRITTTGTVSALTDGADPLTAVALAVGPDDEVWYTDEQHDRLGHVDAVDDAAGTVVHVEGPPVQEPNGIVAGPDGAMWFTTGNVPPEGSPHTPSAIGRRAPDGTITTFTAPWLARPGAIVVGPDGNLWFTNHDDLTGAGIGRITPAGVLTSFTDPALGGPGGLTAGPDGNLWFTDSHGGGGDGGRIGRITPAGVITTFTTPGLVDPSSITAGPDGNLWFTDRGWASAGQIGRVTPAGAFTLFHDGGISRPYDITTGPDGALWFTDGRSWVANEDDTIGRITTAGEVTTFSDPSILAPAAILSGPDGALWFANVARSPAGEWTIGRITTDGAVSSSTAPGLISPGDLTQGHDGRLWFTEPWGARLGAVETGVPPGPFLDVTGGSPFLAPIEWLVGSGIASGYADGRFRPTAPVSRQAMAAFLYRAAGSPDGGHPTCATAPFSDVPTTHAFCGEIAWLRAHGDASGYPDGTFRPAAPVSRQATAAFLHRFAGSPGGAHPSCDHAPFADVDTGHAFCGEIAWLADTGISQGFADGTFRPAAPVSRQAMAAFLQREHDLPAT